MGIFLSPSVEASAIDKGQNRNPAKRRVVALPPSSPIEGV